MVRLFDRRRKPAAKETRPAAEPAASAAAQSVPAPAPRTRTGTSRPPRRDWAAEAAATPAGAPAPKPSSLATSPFEDDANGAPPAKRRRGTRGGRGRKKPGDVLEAATTEVPTDADDEAAAGKRRRGTRGGRGRKKPGMAAEAPAETPALPVAPPKTAPIEEVVAYQGALIETFARELPALLKALLSAIDGLHDRVAAPAVAAAPRVGIFVDVPNLIYAAERRNINLDFGRMLEHFTRGRELVRASAYAPISDDPQAKLETQRFVQYFVGYPYRIITKPLKRFADGSMKANFDIELAIDILTMSDRLDVVVLMSGDGDFRRLVDLVASRGVRVEVVAFAESVANELKAAADLYVDIGANIEAFKLR